MDYEIVSIGHDKNGILCKLCGTLHENERWVKEKYCPKCKKNLKAEKPTGPTELKSLIEEAEEGFIP